MAAERKTLTQLSVPICLETLFYMLSGMVDTLMLSSVSDQAVGAVNCSPSSRQLKKYKFFLPAEIYLLAVFMQLASKFHVFPLVLKFQDSFANVCCCSNLYNLRSFLREYFYQ